MAIKLLSYIFLFYVGFYFYRLAENHNKYKWLCGFLGIISFFFGSILYLLYVRFFTETTINEFEITNLSFKSSIAGFVFTVILFKTLNFIWSKKKKLKNEVDKIGKD
ncbi:hypothetical protein KO506_01135 [Polaribacter vadi]|uniref:hypothetical protein n=1 Tax=Polaribacter TaxID=52959 RepID=UPI001C084465|nr:MULTISPECIES: hypothetical protein [Polaribacter]MBU3010003.1 hypothetical protein [Polaribacter vadi]MDO6739810.1 hypothetical protein [Polaribacter sp. 1_MG-2023]